MQAVFLGGPKHGQILDLDETPISITVDNDAERPTTYELRGGDAEGVGTLPMTTQRVYYAPVGISFEEYHRLWKDVFLMK